MLYLGRNIPLNIGEIRMNMHSTYQGLVEVYQVTQIKKKLLGFEIALMLWSVISIGVLAGIQKCIERRCC